MSRSTERPAADWTTRRSAPSVSSVRWYGGTDVVLCVDGDHWLRVHARDEDRLDEVQGELDRGEIQKVVNAHLREVQACYERRLLRDPTLAGKIIFEWVIQPDGRVGVVRVKFSDVRNTEVSTCIQSSMQRWVFPKPRGGSVTVTYPFVFSTIGL